MVVKVTEIMNTKYLYGALASKLTRLLRAYKDDIIDLCGTKIAEGCLLSIQRLEYEGFHFIDSSVSLHDRIFAENRTRTDSQTSLPLPYFSQNETLRTYIAALKTETPYALEKREQIPIAVLISLARPKVKLDFSLYYPDLFAYVHAEVFPLAKLWKPDLSPACKRA